MSSMVALLCMLLLVEARIEQPCCSLKCFVDVLGAGMVVLGLCKGRVYLNAGEVWVQCDRCRKWRLVTPAVYAQAEHFDKWYCEMNPDRENPTCEEPEDKDPAAQPI